MPKFSKRSRNTDASHSQFNTVGRDQYIVQNTYAADQGTVLGTLNPVDRSGYYVPPCMRGTRQWMLDKILHWLGDDQAPNILLLTGSPGAGKSTIASTLVSRLGEMKVLGSSFFFKRGDVTLSDPAALWRTVASDLAETDAVFAERLIENLNERRVDPRRPDIQLHFKHLIRDPLTECWKRYSEALRLQEVTTRGEAGTSHRGPAKSRHVLTFTAVVVFDALDECGSDSSQSTQRRIFMDTLTKWSRLPSSFKLFITSRDQDIPPSLRDVCYHIPLGTGELVSREADADIERFFEKQFLDIRSKYPSLRSWPGTSIIKHLTNRAAGLFIWADTVIRFLEQGFPKKQLDLILSGAFREEGDAIDQLYQRILSVSFRNLAVLQMVKRVVGAVVLAKIPLYRTDLIYFLGVEDEDESSIDFILERLSSVISTRNTDGRIHISHLSFTEFVCDQRRCQEAYAIDRSIHSGIMTLACLQIMRVNLRFNICQIETSHFRNDDLNLTQRIKENISTRLSYACIFWAEHLHDTAAEAELLREVKDFMQIRLLYWLEVLSLVKLVKAASRALVLICDWTRTLDDDVVGFAVDASKFVAAFASMLSQSTPHLYLSALPFAPKYSIVSMQFLPQFPNTLLIPVGKATHWPAILNVLTGHTDSVTSVSFSQDGKRVVSGSDDFTIRIWDAETGEIVAGPFQGHTNCVTSVSFSQDGKRVVSGSHDKTVQIWDAETGEIVAGPFQGHTDWVTSVSFSQDGKRVVSGSDDKTIRIWDAETGEIVAGPFQGHTRWVTSVSFSQDGKRVVSGSYDETIRIWDAETGEIVAGPFQGHTSVVTSVSFSQDGKRVVSGSDEKTIRIWDAESGEIIAGPFQGHTNSVKSVSFSQDGERVVSGSYDETIRIWDAETGEIVAGPFQGHTDSVTSVSFSQDGKRVVSGSYDKTIRIWDAETGEIVAGPFQGHTTGIKSVSFLQDGKRVVSGSYDETIWIWDAETGEIVAGPFQGHTSWVTSVSFSQDGKRVVSGSYDRTIRIWDAETGEIIAGPFQGHTYGVTSVSFSQDGKRVVSGSYDKTIQIWDAETGEIIAGPFQGHTNQVTSVSFSQDGKRVVSGSYDKTIRIWDAETGEIIAGPFQGHTSIVTSVSFSQDGKWVVSGSYDKTIRIWDAETGEIVAGPFQGHTSTVTSVSFSQDGKRVVSGSHDKTIRIWDAETGKIVAGPFQGHTSGVMSVSFSPDGKRVVSGSYDKTIRIWDTETGEIVAGPFQGHIDSVTSVSFSQDGKRVVSGSDDSTIRIWDYGTGNSISNASSGTFQDNSTMQDGWIIGSNSELLFWIPPIHRTALWRPSNVCVIGENSTRLDMSHFVHGTSWQSCRG